MQKCNEARIQQFLTHELSPDEQQQLEQHLANCATCCKQLEDSTAEQSWWEHASKFLPDATDDMHSLEVGEQDSSEQIETNFHVAVHTVLRWLAPTDDPQMLGRVGNYEVAGVVGAGGMSVVLKALDPALNRFVAIKVMAPHLATSGAARKRFGREAQAAAAIVHDNVIAIHGVDESRGLPFLVMPYEKGDSLQKRLDAHGPLQLKEILRIAKQTAEGLAAAHAQGLIHRDVKPANILLADGVERVKITDFGLARAADDASLTRTGTIAGTPQYMSPEQARGESIDQRSDLFSLGSVIYAMCTGHAPFRAESSYGVLRRITDASPRPVQDINSEVPDWLCRLVDRLHEKQPKDRYASATEVAIDLEQCLAHAQQPSLEPLPPHLERESRRLRVVAGRPALAGLFLVLALMTFIVFTLPGSNTSKKNDLDMEPATESETNNAQHAPNALPSRDQIASPFVWSDETEDDLDAIEFAIQELEAELEFDQVIAPVD